MSKRNKVVKVTKKSRALKKLRMDASLSLRKLADEMNLSFARVHQMESGRDEISEDYLSKFLKATCNSKEDWLFEIGDKEKREVRSDLRLRCFELLERVDEGKLTFVYGVLVGC